MRNLKATDETHKKIKRFAVEREVLMPEALAILVDRAIKREEKEVRGPRAPAKAGVAG